MVPVRSPYSVIVLEVQRVTSLRDLAELSGLILGWQGLGPFDGLFVFRFIGRGLQVLRCRFYQISRGEVMPAGVLPIRYNRPPAAGLASSARSATLAPPYSS